MSASDFWGMSDTACPACGKEGSFEYWYFGPDCRHNPASWGIRCKTCGYKCTKEEDDMRFSVVEMVAWGDEGYRRTHAPPRIA